MSKQNSLREAYEKIKKNNTSPNTNRLTELEQAVANYGKNWQGKENTAELNKKLHFEKMRAAAQSNNELLKKLNNIGENVSKQSELYSKYKTADEYNIAVKNQGYAEKYKNRTYQQISDFIKSDDYNTMRRRGLIDESEAQWLRNQKYALGTSTQLQKELDSIEDLLKKAESIKKTKGSVTVSNMGNEFNPQKSIMPDKSDVAKANENFENQIKALGYKNVEQFNNDIENKKTTADILKTVIAQKKQIESFNQKWGGIKVEENYQPKINENETDSYYIAINQITPKALKSKTIKKHSKSALINDRIVTNADYFAEMEPEEKNKYNKIYETKGITTANQYADDLISLALDKRLNEKVMQKNYDFTSKNGFNAVVGSIASVGESLGSGIEYVTNLLKGETDRRVLSATRAQGLREGTKSHWDSDVWDFVYDTTMSGIDSAAGMALSVAVPYLGEALLGGSAAAHTFNNALDRGVPQGDAVLSSLAAGVAESLFEHVSIGTVLKGGKITAGWTKKGLLQATKKTLVDMGVNFSEETLTEISNVITDRLINGELSNYDISVRDYYMQGMSPEDAKRKAAEDVGTQIGMAGLSGMLMGYRFGTLGSTYGLTKSQILNSKAGSNVVKNGEVEALKTLAKDSGIAEIQKAAEKIDKNSKPSKIGYVFNSLLEEYSKNSTQQLTTALLENGATERGSNSAKGWATQILKNVVSPSNKEAIKQEIALRVNKLTGDVYADFVDNGKYGGDALLNLLEIGEDAPTGIGTQSEVKTGNTVINDQGVEVPVAADGEGAAVGPVMGDTVKGIASVPRSGEIRTIAEAYKQGVAENLEKQRPNPKTAKAEAETKGKTEEEIYFEEHFAKEKQITPEEEQILKDFAKENGLKVEFTDKAVDGKAYGRYADGTIVISRYAKKPMAALFKHEFTHSVEKAKGYAKFQEYVLEKSNAFKQWLNLKGYGKWSELSDKITETYKKDKVKYDNPYAKAKADIIADFVGDCLFGEVVDAKGNPVKLDTNFLVELKQKDRNLFNRFVEWVHSVLKRLTTKGVVNKDIVKLEQKFKRLAETAKRTDTQSGKGEVKDDYDIGSFSLPEIDSTGQKLSQGQRSYFAESKLIDEQGELLRLFHGTKNGGFTKFSAKYSDDGITLFLTPSRELAGTYTDSMDTIKLPEGKKGLARMFETGTDKGKGQSGIYEVYANAKKPYILDCDGASWNKLPFAEKIKGKTNVDTENTFDYKNNILKTKVTLDGKVYEKTFDLNHIVEKVEKIQEGYQSKGFNKERLYKYEFADQAAIEVREYYKTFANEEIADDLTSTAILCMEILDGITRTTKKVIDNKTGEIEHLNTRYVSKWAKENGYDAVWFKNVRDTGAISNNVNTDFTADVVVVFDGSQIKSVNNLEPTKNKDIRYSLPDDGIPEIARGKSYKELDALVKEGKITSDEAFKALGKENGTMPKGENPKVDVDVPEKVSKTKNVNQFMRNVLESGHLDADMTEREKRNIISGARTYVPISDKAALNRAEKKIKVDVNGAVQEWENAINGGRRLTKHDIALGEQLLVQAAETGNANDVTRYVAELAELGTQLGQDIQALRLLKQMTGMGQLYYVTRAVARLNKDIESRYGEKHKIVEIDPNLANILANAKSEAEIDDVVKDLIKDVASQVKSSWVDKFNSWRYLAMLGNPRTHVRNVVGNGGFTPVIGLKNKLGALAEMTFVDKKNRTKTFGFLKPEYRDFATEDFKKVEEVIKGGGKMNPADQIRDQMKVFNTKLLEEARKLNFKALEIEDGWFLKGHYVRALGGAMQARGLDVNNIKPAQLEELRTYAIKEAQKATFRDVSHFANVLGQLRYSNSKLGKVAGVAVEGLLPFKKTPINILKRGIEYSPVGVMMSIADGIVALRKSSIYKKSLAEAEAKKDKAKIKQYTELYNEHKVKSAVEVIDSFSAGLTGTGIMLLGALLWSLGLISGGMDYENEDALERLAGKQPYALKIGDYTYTIDFMAPAVLPFMIGAETAKIFSGEGNEEALGFFDAVAAIGAPMTELSMLQGLNDAIETIAYSDNKMGDFATNIFASYFSQYIPTIGGQIARTFDSTRRTNFVDKNSPFPKIIQTTYQKALGKIPGAENTKVPYIDAWGRTEENDNFLLRAFENFVSPGYISKVTDDSVNNELAKIYTDTGESGVIPKRASASFKVGEETVKLNADEYVQYATDRGQYSRRYMEEVMSNSMYQGLSSDSKAEVISDLFSYANAKAKSNVSDYDYASISTYQTPAKLEAAGISPTSYYIARQAMSVENADRDGSGTVSKSEKKKALREAGFSSRDINTILNVNKK